MICQTLAAAPAEQALELTGRDYLSPSQIRTFQRCPLQWHFRYVQQREPEFLSASLAFGKALHAALERHFNARMAGEPHGELLSVFDSAFEVESAAPSRFGRDESEQTFRDLATRMLAAFEQSEAARPCGSILAIEEELRAAIDAELPELLTRVDLLVAEPDALIVRDFKTARKRWSAGDVNESAGQLLLYAQTAQPLADALDRPLRLEFVVLTKTRQPSVETHPVPLDSHSRQRSLHVVRQVWDAMRAGSVYPNPSPMNCASCPYQRACRNWPG